MHNSVLLPGLGMIKYRGLKIIQNNSAVDAQQNTTEDTIVNFNGISEQDLRAMIISVNRT